MYLEPDKEAAEKVITDSGVYPFVIDDGSVNPENFSLPEGMGNVVVFDPMPVACTTFHSRNTVTLEVHVQVIPKARGCSFIYGMAMLDWLWKEIPVEKLVASVHDRKTLLYTLRLGFKIEGVSPASFLLNGKLLDQTYIGMEKWHQQQQ